MNKRKRKQQAGGLVERGTSAEAIAQDAAERLAAIHSLPVNGVYDWIVDCGLDFSDSLTWETYSTGGANDIINGHTALLEAKRALRK